MCFDLIALSNTTGNNLKRCLLLPRSKEKCVSLKKNTHNHTNRQKTKELSVIENGDVDVSLFVC